MAPPVAWQTHPPQRSPEVPVKGPRARPEGRPGHGRLGVAHTEVTGFTCRGAGRSPSGVPCLPRQRIKGFKTAFVPRPLEYGPGREIDTTPDPAFDVNATDFLDLAAQL